MALATPYLRNYDTPVPPKNFARFRAQLLSWYRKNARDLPWRRTKDPYKIWVSEIMLQQTQVDTVIPYYERWMKRFPTLKSLAESPLSEVLKYWAGLGYYRRARMLHQGARKVQKEWGGRIVQSIAQLQRLPGIGRYTAGAIASIAFGEPVPVLDGNVKRVLARLLAMREAVDTTEGEKKLWGMAEKIVSPSPSPLPAGERVRVRGNPGDLNQSLMELGATVCLPENPRCNICPVGKFCDARRLGREEDFPVVKRKERTEKIRTAALILRNNGKVLIQKQPENGRWGGLWMFPHWPSKKSMTRALNAGTGLPRHARMGAETAPLQHRLTVNHGFTKYRVRLEVFECAARGRKYFFGTSPKKILPSSRLIRRWIKFSDLSSLPLPSPHRKIAEEILKNG